MECSYLNVQSSQHRSCDLRLNQLLVAGQAHSEAKEIKTEEVAPQVATDEPKAVEEVTAVEEAQQHAVFG